MFLSRFIDFIEQNSLFAKGDKILLAVSGGKDSVLMAQLFKQANYNFGIAHCNFGLRGDESLRDQNFVLALADEFKVPFYTINFDTNNYAFTHKISIQMAARELRYQYFENIRQQYNYQKIATAHHQNDAIETVLFNLIRGTGIAGLHGIKSKIGQIIRPLMCFDRGEIDSKIHKQGFTYVEDSSNESKRYTRNHIRHTVIPAMRVVNPGLEKTFKKNIAYYQQVESYLAQQVIKTEVDIIVKTNNLITVNKQKLKAQHSLIVYELLKPFGFSGIDCEQIILKLDTTSGLNFFSKTYHLIIDRENIYIKPITNVSLAEIKINETDTEITFNTNCFTQTGLRNLPEVLTTNLDTIVIDADKLVYPLTMRAWQQGDYFIPFGMKTKKKVSDYFINKKLSLFQKTAIPILVNGNGQIIWLCGMRSDNRFKISELTKRVVCFKMQQKF